MINVPQIKLALGAKFSSVDNELMILGGQTEMDFN